MPHCIFNFFPNELHFSFIVQFFSKKQKNLFYDAIEEFFFFNNTIFNINTELFSKIPRFSIHYFLVLHNVQNLYFYDFFHKEIIFLQYPTP